MDESCKSAASGLFSIKKYLKFPNHYSNGDYSRADTDFDPNQYFKLFTHLKMSPGYVLDYLMFADTLGGKPLLYARKSEDKPFTNDDEFLKSINDQSTDQRTLGPLKHSQDYLQKIILDGTPESYYQFEILSFLGDQFYLSWHANYKDDKLICDGNDLQVIEPDLKDFNLELPQNVVEAAQKMDPQSAIIISEKTVTIRFITFSKWGGFSENLMVLNKQAPYETIKTTKNSIVYYQCGIMF